MFGFATSAPNSSAQDQPLALTVKFLDPSEIARNYESACQRAGDMVKKSSGPLDKTRAVIKTIFGFGVIVAELNPIAKLVVGICNKAWEHIEQIQQRYEDLKQLFDGLEQFAPFIESITNHAREEVLKRTIMALLHLIEDMSNLIINYATRTGTAKAKLLPKVSECTTEVLKRFGELKESFDRAIRVQVLKQVLTSAQRASIDRLKPAAGAHYAGTQPCQGGTRTKVLGEIYAWARDPNTSSKLFWLYGQAGMGKSAIASSVCRTLDDQDALGASFFCKRDEAQLRTPEQLLNTIVYNLASQCNPYGQAVANAIDSNIQLPDAPLEQRYMHLVVRPLKTLKSEVIKSLLIVVDALDECEQGRSRELLLTYLREMSGLVPWIKVFVTSRPEPDIRKAFGSSSDDSADSRSLFNYDPSGDIFEFTQQRMSNMAEKNDLPPWPEDSIISLSMRAGGLFIWAETACKFIEKGTDMTSRLDLVLADTTPTGSSEPLDLLYTTAIAQSMGDRGEDNMRNVRDCLGATVATASRTPLPVAGLESLLLSYIKPGVIRIAVSRLGSVLYEDPSQNGAVRVYHPSFSDFILDPARSKDFHVPPKQQNTMLADCCLKTMMRELRFNICELETSHVLNRDISGLEARVQSAIGRHLAYSCMYWTSHLTATPEGTHRDQLSEFLYSPRLLYWIEAMSLLGDLGMAPSSLLELTDWAANAMNDHSSYANDAYRFVLAFYDAISESTPHLYISALPLAPKRSKLAQQMRVQFPRTLMITKGANETWPNWLQIMNHNYKVQSIACSGDGSRIVSGSCDDPHSAYDGTAQIWDSETGAPVSEPLKSPQVHRVAMTSDGRRVASGSRNGTLQVWNAETGTLVCEPFRGEVDRLEWLKSIAFSPDDRRLYSIDDGGTVQVWEAESGIGLSRFGLEGFRSIYYTKLFTDGRHIASGSRYGDVQVWNTETGAPVTQPMIGHSHSTLRQNQHLRRHHVDT